MAWIPWPNGGHLWTIAVFRTLQASFVQIMRVLLHLRLKDCSLARADKEKSLFVTHEEQRNWRFATLTASDKRSGKRQRMVGATCGLRLL